MVAHVHDVRLMCLYSSLVTFHPGVCSTKGIVIYQLYLVGGTNILSQHSINHSHALHQLLVNSLATMLQAA